MQNESNGTQVLVTGRIVYVPGDLFRGKSLVDDVTKQPVMDTKTGLQKVQYGFGLAVPKADLNDATKGAIYQAIFKEAFELYPSRQLPPDFAYKFKDGDGIDHTGAPFNERAGYAGCLVFALFTNLPIQFVRWDSNLNKNVQMTDGIKCGDWVTVAVQVKAHPPIGRGKAGMYLNPTFVQFVGWGEEIINRPSGDDVFGRNAPAVPNGASATPIANMNQAANMMSPGMAAPQFAQPQQQYAPQQPAQQYQQPQAPAPNHSVLPQQFQPQQPAQQFAPQAPAQPQYQQPQVAPAQMPQQQYAPQQPAQQYQQPAQFAPQQAPAQQGFQQPGMPQAPGQQWNGPR